MMAAKKANVTRFVYAASSSTYGDHNELPKKENIIGKPLSPYAITKYANELYAGIFSDHYGLNVVGLRYFNVFGKRQDPDGAYAAPPAESNAFNISNSFLQGNSKSNIDISY